MNLKSIQQTEITREFEQELERRLAEKLPFIQVVIGPRQVGKTTAIRRIAANFSGKAVLLNADGPAPRSPEWLRINWDEALRLSGDILFIVDEIQKVTAWAETLKSLYDPIRASRRIQVVLLGSASLSIQQGLSAALAGRFEIVRANHWTLAECQKAFGWNLEQFISFGGYPGAASFIADSARWKSFMLDSVIEPVLGRDITGLVPVSKPALFRQTFELSMAYPAQIVSYNKLLGQLQEGGNASTIRHYLELLAGAFLLRMIPRFSGNSVQRRASSPKIIPLAPALAQAYRPASIAADDASWRGRILEAVFGAHLLSGPGAVSYWSEGDNEVDFVCEFEGKLTGFEVKSSRFRKAKSLERFLKAFPKASGRILSAEQIEEILLGKAEL